MILKYINKQVVLTLLCTVIFLTGHSQVALQERQALIDFYNASGGDWSPEQGLGAWLIDDPDALVEDWAGVEVKNGVVIGLELSNYNLKGDFKSFMSALLQLESLERLTLKSAKGVFGTIPDELRHLTQLKSLTLSGTRLSGIIPEALSELYKLRFVDLSKNQLEGAIPSKIGSLINLETLKLNDNALRGLLPVGIGSLTKLIRLDFSNNHITGKIPSSFCNLTLLEELYLSDNELEGVLIPEFNLLRKLRVVAVQDNQFTGKIPNAFGAMFQLEVLNLSGNSFSGTLPSNLKSLENLSVLDFSENAFVFADFEEQHVAFISKLERYAYAPQSKVDTEVIKTVTAGNAMRLTTALSSPNNIYTWFFEEEQIYQGPDKEYVFNTARLQDAGRYYFTVQNQTVKGLVLTRNTIVLEVLDTCEVSNEERQALIAFYNATGGPEWHNTIQGNQPWLVTEASSNVCDWYGVRTVDNRVVEILLADNNLVGELPDTLGALSKLIRLDVHANQLESTLPTALTTIETLTHLNVNGNRFVFDDIVPVYDNLKDKLATFSYAPQRKIGVENTQKLALGSSYTFSVTEFSNPADNTYQWYKDGLPIENATSVSYTIPEVSYTNAGMYSFRATNSKIDQLELIRNVITINVYDPNNSCAVSKATREALVDFYIKTNGHNWENTLSDFHPWLINDPESSVCDWLGVTVINNKLVKLDLARNNLTGVIPPSIGKFSDLRELEFAQNALSVKIPEELWELLNLEKLGLSQNKLEGSIAPEISRLNKLRAINLGTNNLTGSIPSQIGDIPNLNVLVLQTNDLTGGLPSSLGQLKDLEHLQIFGNKISGKIPRTIGALTNLNSLNVSRNQLEGSIPSELGALTNLEYLSLNDNQLSGAIPVSIGNLINVKIIDLKKNKLEGQLPKALGQLQNLVRLHVDENRLSGLIPSEIGALQVLESLDLEENNFSGAIPEALGQLKELRELRLSANNFSGAIPEALGALNQLRGLRLNANKLSGAIPEALGALNQLRELGLSANNLSGTVPSSLGNLENLFSLFLGGNRLTGIFPLSLTQLSGLQILDLSANNLEGALPETIINLNKLYVLMLNHNSFSSKIPSGLSELPLLKKFYFHNNNFVFSDFEDQFDAYRTKIGTIEFQYAPQEKTDELLTFRSEGEDILMTSRAFTSPNNTYQWYKDGVPIEGANQLNYTLKKASAQDEGIYTLNVVNTIVEDLSIERFAIRIGTEGSCYISESDRQILIDFYKATGGDNWKNTLEGNQPWLINDPDSKPCDWYGVSVDTDFNVIGISLPNNGIRGEVPASFGALTRLETLELPENLLSGGFPDAITSLTRLKVLALSENKLVGDLPETIGNFPELQRLELRGNRFAGAIPETIGNNQSLIAIDFSSNKKLTGPIPKSLYTILNLKSVKLNDNRMYGGISASIADLSQLEVFWLSFNNFSGTIPVEMGTLMSLANIQLDHNNFSGDIPLLIPDRTLANTVLQINNNAFVFNDFEAEYEGYQNQIETFTYSPQANVDLYEVRLVELGKATTLTTEQLVSPNNTYVWYKDGVQLRETNLRAIEIKNITKEDLGDYYFISTNSTINALTLTRRRIRLVDKIEPVNPDPSTPVTGSEYTYCNTYNTTVADLLPPKGANSAKWYEYAVEGSVLDPDLKLVYSEILWAEVEGEAYRIPVQLSINEGAPGRIDQEDFQTFGAGSKPTISDLEITGENPVVWFESLSAPTPIALDTPLVHGGLYYAAYDAVSCRFEVEVFIGVPNITTIETQTFCKALKPTLKDIVVFKSKPEFEVFWYASLLGNSRLVETTALVANTTYYVAQYNGVEESKRAAVTVSFFKTTPPIIENSEQTIILRPGEDAYVSDLLARGTHIKWYQNPEGDGTYSFSTRLISGTTYYASNAEVEGGCESEERQAVRVILIEEEAPVLINCEKFHPQPGNRYVISGWVREQGLEEVTSETRDFLEDTSISTLFVELLNHLVTDFVLHREEDKRGRFVPPRYVPDPVTRKYDALVPYLKESGSDNLTIYNFKYEKEVINGIKRIVGFSFSFMPRGINAVPDVRYFTPTYGDKTNPQASYPLLNNPSLSLEFTGLVRNDEPGSSGFRALSNFKIDVGNSTALKNHDIKNVRSPNVYNIQLKKEFKTYKVDPNYQVMHYANSLIEVVYEDKDNNIIDVSDGFYKARFEPEGAVIEGWQRISADFIVPKEASFMSIFLKNTAETAINSYYDDIRVHPFDSNMKTFVYDPVTRRLQSELDENNYATFYEYDQEGGLVRVKKETEEGIYTIQETRSGNSKLNSN